MKKTRINWRYKESMDSEPIVLRFLKICLIKRISILIRI